jgi:VanZ family protein
MSNSRIESIDKFDLPDADKFVHFIFYFTFTLLWYLFLRSVRVFKSLARLRFLIFIAAVLYGACIEACQFLFTEGRSADLLDALANSLGSGSAILILWLLVKKKRDNN